MKRMELQCFIVMFLPSTIAQRMHTIRGDLSPTIIRIDQLQSCFSIT